ncbi:MULTISPECIES: hypothetical protein [Chitinibacter]|uniref:hypothetical protein n=1 Tax=Chitinibacter TaxID=230666 RepID=UPI000646AF93|nr:MULTISPECIES: hypothetical protein [Chitinibacter]
MPSEWIELGLLVALVLWLGVSWYRYRKEGRVMVGSYQPPADGFVLHLYASTRQLTQDRLP